MPRIPPAPPDAPSWARQEGARAESCARLMLRCRTVWPPPSRALRCLSAPRSAHRRRAAAWRTGGSGARQEAARAACAAQRPGDAWSRQALAASRRPWGPPSRRRRLRRLLAAHREAERQQVARAHAGSPAPHRSPPPPPASAHRPRGQQPGWQPGRGWQLEAAPGGHHQQAVNQRFRFLPEQPLVAETPAGRCHRPRVLPLRRHCETEAQQPGALRLLRPLWRLRLLLPLQPPRRATAAAPARGLLRPWR